VRLARYLQVRSSRFMPQRAITYSARLASRLACRFKR
jgi:hypothetical protein